MAMATKSKLSQQQLSYLSRKLRDGVESACHELRNVYYKTWELKRVNGFLAAISSAVPPVAFDGTKRPKNVDAAVAVCEEWVKVCRKAFEDHERKSQEARKSMEESEAKMRSEADSVYEKLLFAGEADAITAVNAFLAKIAKSTVNATNTK